MKAFVFPGQGAQFPGMAHDLHAASTGVRARFDEAAEVLGFDIREVMFHGSEEDLRATDITQPAIFLHSVVLAEALGEAFVPGVVAGHSLGEFSALTAAGALTFADGLALVAERARAMQAACAVVPSTMAAVLGMEDAEVERICAEVPGVVVPANYNCPGQLVISGEISAVEEACRRLSAAGAKRAIVLSVGGAFHSPLMEPARERLARAIATTPVAAPRCPLVSNVHATATTDPDEIRANLVAQLTAPVRWTQSMHTILGLGATEIIEVGPGTVLQGLFKKVDRGLAVSSAALAEPA